MMIIWALFMIRLDLDDEESESRMGQRNELNGMKLNEIAMVMLIMVMIFTVMKIGIRVMMMKMEMKLMMLSLE